MANAKGAKYKFRNSELKTLLHKHEGNISEVARELKVSRSTVYRRIEKYPQLQKVKFQEDERHLDRVEAAMYGAAVGGNITAMIFTLKTKGRHRGWAEKQELQIQANIESKTGGVRTPVDDAKYLGDVLVELRKMGLTDEAPPPPEIIEGELVEIDLGDGLGIDGVDPTEEAPSRTDHIQEDWDKG